MDRAQLARLIGRTWIVVALASLAVLVLAGADAAVGYALAGAWGALNFWALSRLLYAWTGPRPSAFRWCWIGVKALALVGGGYLVLGSGWCGPVAVLLGFSTILAVIVADAVRRFVQGLAQARPGPEGPCVLS